MTAEVTILDYGRGNLLSVARAFNHCGATVKITDRPGGIEAAERLVLPGVGAFGDAMAGLAQRGLLEALANYARGGRPLLGICLGMQLLLDVGEEFGEHRGLGLIPGRVTAIPPTGLDGVRHKIPHIGWNRITAVGDSGWSGTILDGVAEGAEVYFVHSFAAWPDDEENRIADTEYDGRRIAAVIQRDAVVGCQFHPEKSGPVGLGIIANFFKR